MLPVPWLAPRSARKGRASRAAGKGKLKRNPISLLQSPFFPNALRVAGRFIRIAPPEKIKCHDPARRREVGEQTIVEVQVVREPVHHNDRRFRPRVVSNVDPVMVPLHKSLLVDHRSLGKESHRTTKLLRKSAQPASELSLFGADF